jgi:hypothetical protein
MSAMVSVRWVPRLGKHGVRLVGTSSCGLVETEPKRTLKKGPSLKDFLLPASEGQTFKGMKITPPELHPYLTNETLRGDGFSGKSSSIVRSVVPGGKVIPDGPIFKCTLRSWGAR